ncbi:MAG: hypothetical protein Q9162_002781 [Coniocarpon cinnabarinum]
MEAALLHELHEQTLTNEDYVEPYIASEATIELWLKHAWLDRGNDRKGWRYPGVQPTRDAENALDRDVFQLLPKRRAEHQVMTMIQQRKQKQHDQWFRALLLRTDREGKTELEHYHRKQAQRQAKAEEEGRRRAAEARKVREYKELQQLLHPPPRRPTPPPRVISPFKPEDDNTGIWEPNQ